MVTRYRVLGKAIPRVDGVMKVTGAAKYTADLSVPGMLWGKTLKSPHLHARIVRIDTKAALELPGVYAVITGADTVGHLYGRSLRDIPPLAHDRVRYAGERVAAVAADDEDIAEQALGLIEVEYEELPAVLDTQAAMMADAPILHPDFNSYAGIRAPLDQPSNAYIQTSFEKGDIEKAFAEADFVVENTYRCQTQSGAYIEPQAVIVWDDKSSGRVQLWSCTKAPFRTKEPVAATLGIDEEQLLMHPVFVGGDFGNKGTPSDIPIAYFLSKACGRPVKMVHDYVEELLAGNPSQDMLYRLKTGVRRDGTIIAHQIQHFANCGAYAGYKPSGAMGAANSAAGPYRVDNVQIESANVYTNTLPGQILRAPGQPQAAFALESHLNEVARAIGVDPVELRLKNLIETGDEMAAGERLEDVRARQTLQAALDAAGYREPKAPLIGRGVAISNRGQGGGQATAQATLRPDGSLLLGTPVFDQGTGSHTTVYQTVEEELGVSFDRVELDPWDTDAISFDAGLGGSIQSRLSSTVGYEVAQDLKRALISFVARHQGWPAQDLRLQGEEVWNSDIEEQVNWRQLLQETGEEVVGRAHINENVRGNFTSFAAQVAEVSVDPETGQAQLLKLVTAHDVGQVLNSIGHQGQINGAVIQGIGFALMEELVVEDGRVTNGSFGDYKIPTTADIPELTTVLLEASEQGSGPYRVKGIGEIPMVPVAAAIANAIEDACGARIRTLPITAEKIYRALTSP
jgi:CO/xanthine dehydrogenase Mo-binding subunit